MNVLPLYPEYINNFPDAIETLERLQKNSKNFQNYLKNCAQKTKLDVDLAALLELPFKQIPKYYPFLQVYFMKFNQNF